MQVAMNILNSGRFGFATSAGAMKIVLGEQTEQNDYSYKILTHDCSWHIVDATIPLCKPCMNRSLSWSEQSKYTNKSPNL